jgi:DNA topoisomerase-2
MRRRVFDIAACVSSHDVKVVLNGTAVNLHSFEEYASLYPPVAQWHFITLAGSRWDVGVGLVEPGKAHHVSFVNGIATERGGSHVTIILEQVERHLSAYCKKALSKQLGKDTVLTNFNLRNRIALFVNANVLNPTFDSQTKDYLVTPLKDMSGVTLKASFLQKLAEESNIEEVISEWLKVR